ncbi:MAG: hypothetical protein AB8V02_07215 [Francisella endosymbiont of Hyalomma asiaticum]
MWLTIVFMVIYKSIYINQYIYKPMGFIFTSILKLEEVSIDPCAALRNAYI